MNGSPTHHPSLSPSSELFHSSHQGSFTLPKQLVFWKSFRRGWCSFLNQHVADFLVRNILRLYLAKISKNTKSICFGRFPLSFFTTPTYFCAILISSLPQCLSLSPDPPPPRPQMLSVARRPNHRPPGAVLVFHQNTVFTVFLTEFSECSLIELSAFFGTGRFLIDRKVSPDPRQLILDVFIFSPIWLQGHLIKILHERESYTFQSFDFLNLIMNCLFS